jgi:Chaperone of endosialidase
LGYSAGANVTTANNVICIGSTVLGENINNHTYIGNINTTTVSGGNADFVTVDLTTGLLGHLSSSRRYKEDIKPMDIASEALYQLKPVTYRYKKEIDRTQSLDYGLVAEEVAQIDPNLTLRGQNGQIESVRYTAVNAMLLNEFLKEHKAFIEEQRKVQQQDRKIEEQEATIAQLKHQMETVVARIKEHDSEIEKVNARIGISESVPQVVANEP